MDIANHVLRNSDRDFHRALHEQLEHGLPSGHFLEGLDVTSGDDAVEGRLKLGLREVASREIELCPVVAHVLPGALISGAGLGDRLLRRRARVLALNSALAVVATLFLRQSGLCP